MISLICTKCCYDLFILTFQHYVDFRATCSINAAVMAFRFSDQYRTTVSDCLSFFCSATGVHNKQAWTCPSTSVALAKYIYVYVAQRLMKIVLKEFSTTTTTRRCLTLDKFNAIKLFICIEKGRMNDFKFFVKFWRMQQNRLHFIHNFSKKNEEVMMEKLRKKTFSENLGKDFFVTLYLTLS